MVSKAEILDNVWDSAYSGGDNVVEVYISYLRRKIDEPFGLQTLQTVAGWATGWTRTIRETVRGRRPIRRGPHGAD